MKFPFPPARLSLLFLWAAFASLSAGQAEETIARYRWEDASRTASPVSLVHEEITNGILKVSNPTSQPLQINLLTIIHPRITADFYGLRGQVSYQNVAGDGYLEMWNSFPGGGSYFSRTLGNQATDPMAKISGSSDWRTFFLPFNATGANAHPERLTLNLVLPGRGTVFMGPPELIQVAAPERSSWRVIHFAPILAAAVFLLAGAWAWALWHRRRRDRSAEWRRMAALDT